ncbi:galactose-3-O-sulfotransferase 2-like isoform X2 [Mercenaria mercenaria]|uniref:galactose-3-O-sulfotransferase 2-like isoform X2 n=1 Tax=Mercenaria mercenaria TaxID=6596 RepID=UPI00234E842A|nr:galactose-3-O-sulfotransferase 2-like isoform X2 [Mercenaria mercenaria]XP_053408250.1 galactose-3-O-sulfotransferase 2-like isoform X2 [Mercenaria mercenaria]
MRTTTRNNKFIGIILLPALATCCLWTFSTTVSTEISVKNTFNGNKPGNESIKQGDKIQRIAYLKVPKTGSTTLACMFIRFGIRNNLSVFLSKKSSVSESKQKLLLKQEKQFDIFATHTLYNYTFFTHIVRNPSIIGSVGEPGQMIISNAFLAYRYTTINKDDGISSQKFIDEIVSNTSNYQLHKVMSRYFGISEVKNYRHMQKILATLNSEFSLVLVIERFNESLILLKRLLNWSFADITYSTKMLNHHGKVFLNNFQIDHLRTTNSLEYKIYEYFLNELNRKIKNAINNFWGEVRYFEHILNEIHSFCQNPSNNNNAYVFPPSRWGAGFSINLEECFMIFNIDDIRFKQQSKIFGIDLIE